MINYLLFFMLGSFFGLIISLFIIGSGNINKNYDSYQEGFMDGYQMGKKE